MFLDPADRWGPQSLRGAGSVLGYDEFGNIVWRENRPLLHTKAWHEQACAGVPQVTANQDWNYVAGGTAALISQYQSLDGKRQGCGKYETGTQASGHAILSTGYNGGDNTTMVAFNSTSGTHVYEALPFQIPTLSDATNKFVVYGGFSITASDSAGDGAFFQGNSDTDTHFQVSTVNVAGGGGSTTTTTGITIVAGTWYRAKIVVTNDTSVAFYLIADDTYHSNGRSYGAAVATHTTNIPNQSGASKLGCVLGIRKKASTTNRFAYFVGFNFYRYPTITGGASPAVSMIGIDDGSLNPQDQLGIPTGQQGQRIIRGAIEHEWAFPQRNVDEVPFHSYDSGVAGDHLATHTSGTLATLSRLGLAGFPQLNQLTTGTDTTGRCARAFYDTGGAAATLQQDANSGHMVFECLFRIPTLSDGTNTFTTRLGFLDTVSAGPAFGAWFELESNASTSIQCKTADGTTTTTSASMVIVANTWYWCRIVLIDNTSAVFQINALDSTIATNTNTLTTNLPVSGSLSFFHGMTVIKSAGGTARTVQYAHLNAYQRLAA